MKFYINIDLVLFQYVLQKLYKKNCNTFSHARNKSFLHTCAAPNVESGFGCEVI